MTQSINYKAVCRTAQATPGLLIMSLVGQQETNFCVTKYYQIFGSLSLKTMFFMNSTPLDHS